MRILSLAPSNNEILYALGLERHIIGVTSYCDYPKGVADKPKIGSWITQTASQIKDLQPNLIITCYYLPPELRDWTGPGEIVHVEPRKIDDIFASIKEIGHKTGAIRIAERLVAKMQADIAELMRNNTAIKRKKLRVYMEEWPQPPMVSENWVPQLVKIAGGMPVMDRTGEPSGEFPFSMLERENPDVMIFHWCGFKTKFNKQLVVSRPGWSGLKAVRENRLFVIDDSLINRPGPRIIEGIKHIKNILSKDTL